MQNYSDRELEEEYSKWELKINYVKTEYLSTDPSENLKKIIIKGKKIQTAHSYKYL